MHLYHRVCAGGDVHKVQITVCLRTVDEDGTVRKEVRVFTTTRAGLMALSAWLREAGCTVIAMESTGVYWKPVWNVLVQEFEVIVGNAHEMARNPGRKTDKMDADWISELLAHGLIRPSFVPPPQIRALRDLTRARVSRVKSRTSAKNRVAKLLEDANIKLSCEATDIFGATGRAVLDALVRGERDPAALAALAKGSLRGKIAGLQLALDGYFTEHHATLLGMLLEEIDLANCHITGIDAKIATLAAPLRAEVEHLATIPGVKNTAAQAVLGEIGPDVSRFGSAARLASWAKICAGNNESAGKRRSGRTGKGNRYLRRVLVQCAWAARKTDSFLGRKFRTLQARIGGKKAAVAVGHQILVIVYHLLLRGESYDEQRYRREGDKERAKLQRALRTLQEAGFLVNLTPAEQAA